MEEQEGRLSPQESLKKAKSAFKWAIIFCSVISVVVVAGVICLLVLTDDIYSPLVLSVALAFGWLFEGVTIINPAYRKIKELEAGNSAFENTENSN